MSATYVQNWSNVALDTSATFIITVGTDATAGNTLVASIQPRFGDTYTLLTDPPTGWTEIQQASSDQSSAVFYLWTRTATGDANDNITVTLSSERGFSGYVVEVSGSDGVDGSAIHPTDGWTFNDTTVSTGAVTPSAANGLAIAFFHTLQWHLWSSGSTAGQGMEITGDFADLEFVKYNQAGAAMSGMARYNFTSAAEIDSTWSTTDTGEDAGGAVVVFVDAATSTVSPSGIQKLENQSAPVAAAGLNGVIQ